MATEDDVGSPGLLVPSLPTMHATFACVVPYTVESVPIVTS
jgi:hypothetical protein